MYSNLPLKYCVLLIKRWPVGQSLFSCTIHDIITIESALDMRQKRDRIAVRNKKNVDMR